MTNSSPLPLTGEGLGERELPIEKRLLSLTLSPDSGGEGIG